MFVAHSYTAPWRQYLASIILTLLLIVAQSAEAQSGKPKVTTKNQPAILDALTQYQMGSKYRLGIGVEADPEIALKWFTKAANQGSAKAEYAVGWMLAFSDNPPHDYAAALPWLLKASGPHPGPIESGYRDTQKRANAKLDWMCKKGVVEFPQTHLYAADPKCLLARGNRLFYGRDKLGEILADSKNYHVEKDYVAARSFLERALEGGQKSAAINLTKIHQQGLGVPKNQEKFEVYLNIAGKTNDGKTNFFLAERAKEKNEIADICPV